MTITITYTTGMKEVFKDVVYWDTNKADFVTVQTKSTVTLLGLDIVDRIDIAA